MNPSIEHIMQWFEYKHLPEHLQVVSKGFCHMAHNGVTNLPHNPELAEGLRKLLEAKDCFVRAKLAEKSDG